MKKDRVYRKVLEASKDVIPVADLKPSPYNPRDITPEAKRSLKKSIEKFGLAGDIVWNRRSGHVVSGHQRLEILKKQGYDAISVIVLDLDPEEEKALNVHLNNRMAQGHFTSAVDAIMAELREGRPDLFDDLRLFDVKSEIDYLDSKDKPSKTEQEKTLRELEVRPFEHWDYIVFVFDSHPDWMNACSRLGIEHCDISPSPKHQKIGIGRVLRGERLVRIIGHIDDSTLKDIMA